MNTREIRTLLRGNIDPRLGKVLIAQQEDIAALKQQVMTLAGSLDFLASMLQRQVNVIERVKDQSALAQRVRNDASSVAAEPSMTGQYDEL